MRAFKQLNQRDRVLISRLKAMGYSLSEIAKKLGKNKSTISREIRRNDEDYDDEMFRGWTAEAAQKCRDLRVWRTNQIRRRKKSNTRDWIISQLKEGWSPQQIAGRSSVNGPESVSHECIYQLVALDRKKGGGLFRLLKRFKKRKARFGRKYPCILKDDSRMKIKARPLIVDQCERLGDLEADLIVGYKSEGYVLTVIDRKSQLVCLRKLPSKHKTKVADQLVYALKKFRLAHTLTVDNGREFLGYQHVTRATGVAIYFTDPYCSTQRARVENMNGLIRYYLPKKTSFKSLNQAQLNTIEKRLNNRPRKTLKFLTPLETHDNLLKISVAFES